VLPQENWVVLAVGGGPVAAIGNRVLDVLIGGR